MTREEAIAYFKRHIELYCVEGMCREAEDMAIKALEQEPCEDAISRQAVLNILDDMVKDYIKENDFDKAQGVAWVKVQKLPPVTPQPKTGHWVELTELSCAEYSCYVCSECEAYAKDHSRRLRVQHYKSLFCPDCGLKMEVDK